MCVCVYVYIYTVTQLYTHNVQSFIIDRIAGQNRMPLISHLKQGQPSDFVVVVVVSFTIFLG